MSAYAAGRRAMLRHHGIRGRVLKRAVYAEVEIGGAVAQILFGEAEQVDWDELRECLGLLRHGRLRSIVTAVRQRLAAHRIIEFGRFTLILLAADLDGLRSLISERRAKAA